MAHRLWILFVFLLLQADYSMAQVRLEAPDAPAELPSPSLSEYRQPTANTDDIPPNDAVTGNLDSVGACAAGDCDVDACLQLDEFRGYRVGQGSLDWIVGDGNQFGAFSFGSDHYVAGGVESGLGFGIRFHFLAGPDRTDMPPRVFDFSLGYQKRELIGDLAYDVSVAVLAASDFEGSSRDGIRFPSHAVGYLTLTETTDLVLGADYLDRDDVKVLPVIGLILRPGPALRMELVFPYPRIDWQVTDTRRLFLRGALGGGTWAVERDSGLDDLATYSDLRIGIGLEHVPAEGSPSAIEIAYLFDRKLKFTSGIGDYQANGTVMIRSVTTY